MQLWIMTTKLILMCFSLFFCEEQSALFLGKGKLDLGVVGVMV